MTLEEILFKIDRIHTHHYMKWVPTEEQKGYRKAQIDIIKWLRPELTQLKSESYQSGRESVLELDVMQDEEQNLVKDREFFRCKTCFFMVASDKFCKCTLQNKLRQEIKQAINKGENND